jgi:putative phage-type endonuclease
MGTVTHIENSEQWHALRKNVVGASEAGALVGVHPYLTYYQLWARKSGKLPPQEETAAMERGTLLQPVAVELIRKRHPALELVIPHEHYADHVYGLGATPDLLAHHPIKRDGNIQIKSVEPGVFRRDWLGDNDAPVVPSWIAIQALMEAELTGASWAAVAALVVTHKLELHLIDIAPHPGLIETIKSAALRFWKLVLSGREPPPDYARDGALIRALFPKDDGSEVDLTGDNELPDLLDQRDAAKSIKKQVEEEIEAIDGQLIHRLGDAARARFNGGTISLKTINRAAYQVKATSFRQLRVMRDKE